MAEPRYRLTFAGFLAVRLIRFEYAGREYRYHGRRLQNAVKRLTAPGGPQKATTAELIVWGQACHDWKERGDG